MGIFYRKGICGMFELVVVYFFEIIIFEDFRVFFRVLYCSGLFVRVDVIFFFLLRFLVVEFVVVIYEEEIYF